MNRCPVCKSSNPSDHPAVQCGGEVELCIHDFHLTPTPSNRPDYIKAVLDKRAQLARDSHERP